MTASTASALSSASSGGQPSAGRRWIALAVLCVSLLIVVLDNTVLNVVLPTLVRRLNATTTELQWIVDAYVIVFAGLLLVSGSVADRVGRKRTFVAGLGAFAIGSTWAAFSGSVGYLIAARASMGIGGALIMPSTLSIITDMFQDRGERQRAIGVWAGTSGVGVALGPIIGGLLLAHYWWGSVFLINVPIAVAGLALAIPLVPDSRKAVAPRPDIAGAGLSVAGVGLVLWSIIEAPVHGWSSPAVIGAGAAGIVVLAGFARWELVSSHPMLSLSLFRRRAYSGAISSIWLVTFGLFGALFVMTQYLQFSLGYTALETGVRILPAAGAVAVVAPVSAALVRVIGTRFTVALGLLIIAGGLLQISAASSSTSYAGVLPGMIMLGMGAGLGIPSATASVMGSVPPDDTGVGAASNGAVMQVGGALGVAVIGSLLATRYQDRMSAIVAPYHVPHQAAHAILGSLGGALDIAERIGGATGGLLASAARTAFISGMDLGLRTAAAAGLGGVLIALLALPGFRRRRRSAAPPPARSG